MRKLALSLAALTAIATSITLAAAPANAESMADPSAQAGEPSTERYVVVTDGSAAPLASLNAEAADGAETYPNVGATVTELTPVQAAELDARRGVTVAPDTRVSLVPDPGFTPKEEKANGAPMTSLEPEVDATGYANSWGLDRIDQRTLPLSGTYTPNRGVDGRGVDVYVIDTGLATQHPEFQGRVGNGYDFVDGDSIPQEGGSVPHGTHVAGTIASTLYGVAPQSTIHGVRVLNSDGQGYVSDVIAGMDWVVGERARIGHTVVANMSVGGPYNSAFNAATANMFRNGVVTVVAAGNNADNAAYYSPGSTPEAITVAASTSDDYEASYSNYGSEIDLYAPGSDIWSTYAYDPSLKYRLSGTSMATPHVAGWAALYLGLHPDATPSQVRGGLVTSGTIGMINGVVGGTPNVLPYVGDLAGAPSPPTGIAASRGDRSARLTWTASSSGGSPVTGYTVTSSPGGITTTVPGDATSATLTGLTNGTAYTFTVTATNAIGTSAASTSSNSVTPAGIPAAPSNADAARGDGQAVVTWTAPANNGSAITSYTVTSTPGGITQTVSGNQTTATITGLTNGTAYTFTVTATNAVGTSAASTSSNSVTPDGVPPAPSNAAAARGDGQAVVTWTVSSHGGSPVTGYTVTSSPGGITTSVRGDATSATLTGLTNGTAYTFTVTATNVIGTSPASTSSNSVTPAGVTPAPSNAAAARGDEQAAVTWTAPASNGSAITSYTVTSTPGGITQTVSGNQTTATITGLTNGTAYTFTVTATNAIGTSAASTSSNSVTPAGVTPAPSNAAAVRGDRQADVTWTAPANNGSAITSYTVTSTPGGITQTVSGNQTTATITGLTNGTAYTFTVTATNAIGDSPSTAPSNQVTPAGLPGAPRIGTAKSGAPGGRVTGAAAWKPPTTNGGAPITGYRITAYRYRANGTIASTTVSPTLAPSARTYNMKLPVKGRYRFKCTALNAIGPSQSSIRSNMISAR